MREFNFSNLIRKCFKFWSFMSLIETGNIWQVCTIYIVGRLCLKGPLEDDEQCDQFVQFFLKMLAKHFLTKVPSPNIRRLLGYFEQHGFWVKTPVTTFWLTIRHFLCHTDIESRQLHHTTAHHSATTYINPTTMTCHLFCSILEIVAANLWPIRISLSWQNIVASVNRTNVV